jgi:hypothetical protein
VGEPALRSDDATTEDEGSVPSVRLWRRHRSLAGTGVLFVSGGEPIEGCDAITLLVLGDSPDEAESRARDLGVWDPSAWDDMRIRPQDVELALADPQGFAWKPGYERDWRGSNSWPGHGSRTDST